MFKWIPPVKTTGINDEFETNDDGNSNENCVKATFESKKGNIEAEGSDVDAKKRKTRERNRINSQNYRARKKAARERKPLLVQQQEIKKERRYNRESKQEWRKKLSKEKKRCIQRKEFSSEASSVPQEATGEGRKKHNSTSVPFL